MKLMNKTNIAAVAALLLALQPWNPAKATVFIDLDLSGDTAKNSGSMGDGNVGVYDPSSNNMLPSTGTWKDANAAGNPAGRAYYTGANASGATVTNAPNGVIFWNWDVATALNSATTLTFYAWIKPDTLMAGGRLWAWGKANSLIEKAANSDGTMRLNTTLNGTTVSFSFGDAASSVLGDNAVGKWVFVGVTYDSAAGTMTAVAGRADDANLVSESKTGLAMGAVAEERTGFVLLNSSYAKNNNRPFAGALGDFYLSNEAVDFKAVFDAQKAAFKAVSK
jgi:hypothetical protein